MGLCSRAPVGVFCVCLFLCMLLCEYGAGVIVCVTGGELICTGVHVSE